MKWCENVFIETKKILKIFRKIIMYIFKALSNSFSILLGFFSSLTSAIFQNTQKFCFQRVKLFWTGPLPVAISFHFKKFTSMVSTSSPDYCPHVNAPAYFYMDTTDLLRFRKAIRIILILCCRVVCAGIFLMLLPI